MRALWTTRRARRARGTAPLRCAAAALGAGLLLAACASSGGQTQETGTDRETSGFTAGMVNVQDAAGDPVHGGDLVTGVQLLPNSLDPAVTGARDDAGAALAMTYDVLMRYNVETGEFEPQLAEHLESDAEFTEWTLTLREGVRFSDGTALDADAVIASIERYNTRAGNGSSLWTRSVERMTAEDRSTVTFTLSQPWERFPSMLALGHGMIVAPAADEGETFAPIGAGAFTVEDFNPGAEYVFAANPDYWGEGPYLDRVTMAVMNGPQANLESLQSGQLDVGYIRGLGPAIHTAIDQGYPGYVGVLNAGGTEIINNRDGRPGSDERVRRAIAHAIDPQLIDERAEDGQGMPTGELFGPWSEWHTDVDGPAYDPDTARDLLAQAKADGYDGRLDYVVLNEPKDAAIAQTVAALLEAVGFDVDVQALAGMADLLGRVYVDYDFDLAHAGIGLYESIPDLGLESTTFSGVRSNTAGYADAQMDELILEFQQATAAEAPGMLARIQQRWNETVPSVVISAIPSIFAWQDRVHGIVPTATSIMLYDKAWIAD